MWAALIPAAIGAIGGIASSRAQANAAGRAADASSQATRETNALNERIWQQGRTDNEPWRQVGGGAINRLGALYDVGPGAAAAPPSAPGLDVSGYFGANGDVAAEYDRVRANGGRADYSNEVFETPEEYAQWHASRFGQAEGRQGIAMAPPPPSNAPPGSDPRFSDFYDSPDYSFRFAEGQRAINANRATNGLMQSGSTLKALQAFGQNTAAAEYGNYFNRLSSLAGIGQAANSANQQAGQNYAANTGNALMQNARNLGSSYQQQGAANAQGINSLFGAAGYAWDGIAAKKGWS